MLSISVEKQRKRPPSFKFCLADGWAGSWRAEGPDLAIGNILQNCLFLLFQMLSISKQRTCSPFLKLCFGDQTKQTKLYYRIVFFYYFKCFRLVLKSKGNASLFSNFVWQRKCPHFLKLCLAIVYFYYFKRFRLELKSKGNACPFPSSVWRQMGGEPAGGGARLVKRKYIL